MRNPIEQIDWRGIIPGTHVTSTTLKGLISTSSVGFGVSYFVTNLNIIVMGVSSTKVSLEGTRIMSVVKNEYYTPNTVTGVPNQVYGGVYGHLIARGSYPISDATNEYYVVWGGKVWKRNTSGVDTVFSDEKLGDGWTVQTDAMFYELKIFSVVYDIDNDLVIEQSDNRGNVIKAKLPKEQLFIPDNNAIWVGTIGAVTTSLGKIVPSSTAIGWDKGATFGSIPSATNGKLSFNPVYMPGQSSNGQAMIGLSSDAIPSTWTDIDYCIFFYDASFNVAEVYELGVYKGTFASWSVLDTYTIERIGTTVEYKKNGTTFYTSLTSSSQELFFDCSINRYLGAENIEIYASIPFNTIDVTDWGNEKIKNNENLGVYNNVCEYVTYNYNNGVLGNNLVDGEDIDYNINNGDIYENFAYFLTNNTNNGEIINNVINGNIVSNTNNGSIDNNSNFGIVLNSNQGNIESNSNGGNITANSNNGSIESNTNNLSVTSNTNNGDVYLNSIDGDIQGNSNNGGIYRNDSATPVSIINNTNNGDIGTTASTTTRLTTVSDATVNK